jgi:hypothetical protein
MHQRRPVLLRDPEVAVRDPDQPLRIEPARVVLQFRFGPIVHRPLVPAVQVGQTGHRPPGLPDDGDRLHELHAVDAATTVRDPDAQDHRRVLRDGERLAVLPIVVPAARSPVGHHPELARRIAGAVPDVAAHAAKQDLVVVQHRIRQDRILGAANRNIWEQSDRRHLSGRRGRRHGRRLSASRSRRRGRRRGLRGLPGVRRHWRRRASQGRAGGGHGAGGHDRRQRPRGDPPTADGHPEPR